MPEAGPRQVAKTFYLSPVCFVPLPGWAPCSVRSQVIQRPSRVTSPPLIQLRVSSPDLLVPDLKVFSIQAPNQPAKPSALSTSQYLFLLRATLPSKQVGWPPYLHGLKPSGRTFLHSNSSGLSHVQRAPPDPADAAQSQVLPFRSSLSSP